MSSSDLLNAKFVEFSEYLSNLSKLDNDKVKEYRNDIKLKGRTFIKFQAEVKLLNDEDLISKFSELMTQFKTVRAIANGQKPQIQTICDESKDPVKYFQHIQT